LEMEDFGDGRFLAGVAWRETEATDFIGNRGKCSNAIPCLQLTHHRRHYVHHELKTYRVCLKAR
jgi:hypothetical protein